MIQCVHCFPNQFRGFKNSKLEIIISKNKFKIHSFSKLCVKKKELCVRPAQTFVTIYAEIIPSRSQFCTASTEFTQSQNKMLTEHITKISHHVKINYHRSVLSKAQNKTSHISFVKVVHQHHAIFNSTYHHKVLSTFKMLNQKINI